MRVLIILMLLNIAKLSYAQNIEFNYVGTLILSNNSVISFSLNLIEKNGIVNGYSITNIGLEDETKSEISGLYFTSDKSFQLQETQILSTKSESALNTFCYINMTLSFKGKFGSKRLEGTFTGNFLDSTECASGKIILMEKKKIEKKIAKVKKKVERKYNKEYQDTSLIKRTQVLKDGNDFTINWVSNKLKMFIWDANQEDGDKITVIINGNSILTDFETTNKRKKITFKLKQGENTVEIRATNLGTSPPNTSRIELVDSKTKYPIITQLTLEKSAIIKIIK